MIKDLTNNEEYLLTQAVILAELLQINSNSPHCCYATRLEERQNEQLNRLRDDICYIGAETRLFDATKKTWRLVVRLRKAYNETPHENWDKALETTVDNWFLKEIRNNEQVK